MNMRSHGVDAERKKANGTDQQGAFAERCEAFGEGVAQMGTKIVTEGKKVGERMRQFFSPAPAAKPAEQKNAAENTNQNKP